MTTQTATKSGKNTAPVGWRLIWAGAGLLILLVGVAGFLLLNHHKARARANAQTQLAAIADLKSRQIAAWMMERRGDARAAGHQGQLRQYLERPNDAVLRDELVPWMTSLVEAYDYNRVGLFDASGTPRLEVPAGAFGASTNWLGHIAGGLRARDVFVADLHRDSRADPVHLSLVIPIGLKRQAGQPADGVLLLDIDPGRFLYPLIQSWPVPSRTAETLLVRREGGDVVFLNTLRHATNAPLTFRLPIDPRRRLPAAVAALGQEGSVEGIDYRGVAVLAAVRRIPETPWFMVAKIDEDEVHVPVRRELLLDALFTASLMVVIYLGVSLLRRQSKLASARQESAELKRHQLEIERLSRLYATLSQVNQAIVRVESREVLFGEICRVAVEFGRFCVVWIGEHHAKERELVAVAYAGQSPEFAKTLHVYTDDRPEARGPSGIAFRKNQTQVSNDSLGDPDAGPWRDALVSAGIKSSASVPIRFGGQPWGVISLYAAERNFFFDPEVKLLEEMALDISFALDHLAAAQALRASEERHRSLFEHATDGILLLKEDGQIVDCSQSFARMHGYTREEILRLTLKDLDTPATFRELPGRLRRQAAVEGSSFEVEHRHHDGHTFPLEVTWNLISVDDRKIIQCFHRDVTERRRAEEDLRESEEKFRAYTEHSAEAIFVHDYSGRFLDVNGQACTSLGYAREELLRMTVFDVETDFNLTQAQAVWSQIQPNRPLTADGHHRRKDGSVFPVEIRSGCFERKGQTYYLGLVRDLTLRKQADESIRLLHHAIEQTPAIVVITDLRGNIEYVNRQFVLSTGYSIEEVRGKNPRLLKSGKMAASFYQQLWQTITAGNDWSGEFLNRRKDGGLYWEQAVISPLKNPDGRVTHFVGVKQDITAQKTFEEKIGEQARLINEALDAIILNDMEGTILLWNHGAEATFGWPSPEALGKKLAGFLKHDPLKYEAAWRELLEKGRWTGELAAQTRDGRRITIDSRLTMLRGEDGGPQKILTICHDVTAQKEMEARYLRAQRQQTLGTLSGGVAHDLNNILAPFLVGLPLIRAEISNPEVQQLVSMMETSVQRGADIVKQLLLFGRGSAPQRVPLGMDRPVREVEKIIRETFPKNLVLRTSWSESLWPVLGDPTQIYQALLNICVNARDAMPAGGTLTISLKNRELDTSAATLNPRAKPGSYVVLSVRDTGGGITPEVQDRMFEPFFTTKDVGEGTGLGLSVVLGVVESHGGFVNVNSQVGAGTEFVIYLPAQLVPPEESPAGQTAQLAAGRGELVLLVDDEPAIRKVVGKILERSGYRVLLADGGAEALELHAQHGNEIKVVVSDYSMPDMDGLALAEALHKSRPDLKIIIGSGLGQNLDESLFLAQGVVRILRKPFAAQTILTALRETLDGSAALRPEL